MRAPPVRCSMSRKSFVFRNFPFSAVFRAETYPRIISRAPAHMFLAASATARFAS